MTESITRLSTPHCPEWCVSDHANDRARCVNPADDVFMCDGTPTFVDLGSKRAEIFPAIAFRSDGTEVERSVYINVPESDITVTQVDELADALAEAGSVLERMPIELDSSTSAEEQEEGGDYIAGVVKRVQAATDGFGTSEWAALGRFMLAEQAHGDGRSMYINTTQFVSDLSGVPLQRLWLWDES